MSAALNCAARVRLHVLAAADGPPAQLLIGPSAVKAHRQRGQRGSTPRQSVDRAAYARQKSPVKEDHQFALAILPSKYSWQNGGK
jgi:hypothetical protein